jgi:hypothetical protein
MPQLFDIVERTDSSSASPVEDSFTFLNRAAGVVWERQRELLERWYGAFPDADEDLQRRFRSRKPQQHYAAWWELYIHSLLQALDYEVTVHPVLPGTKGRTDFLAERPREESFYVEAKTVFSGIVAPPRGARLRAPIEAALMTVDASVFYVTLKFDQLGERMPRREAIVGPVVEWLDGLDPEQVRAESSDPRAERWTYFQIGDWLISMIPSAWSPRLRGCPLNPFIGSRMGIGGATNDVPKIRQAVMRKGRHYGEPDKPLVVAVLATNGFVDDRDVTNALFGSESMRVDIQTGATRLARNPDGVWVGKAGAAGRRISAVLMGVGVLPHSAATTWPHLWHHYDPHRVLTADLPFAAVRVVGDQLAFSEVSRTADETFGLPADWPGPEPAFPRCLHRPEDHRPQASGASTDGSPGEG